MAAVEVKPAVTLRIVWHTFLHAIWHNRELFTQAPWTNWRCWINPPVRALSSVFELSNPSLEQDTAVKFDRQRSRNPVSRSAVSRVSSKPLAVSALLWRLVGLSIVEPRKATRRVLDRGLCRHL